MSVVEPGRVRSGLMGRIWLVLTRPTGAWDVIEADAAGVGEITRSYVLPLAAIPALAGVVGALAFPDSVWGVTIRPTPVDAVVQELIGYVVSVAAVFLEAAVLHLLAPAFGAERNYLRAFKLSAHASTAAWVAGFLFVNPSIGLLGTTLAVVWGLYTLYRGMPRMMRAPEPRVLLYFAAWLALLVLILGVIMVGVIEVEGLVSGPLSTR